MSRCAIYFFIAFLFLNGSARAQALGTDPEAGRGTYKNRVFFNLERYWDSAKVCNNPHKGWGVHYYDNGIGKYGNRLSANDSLPGFPGLNDIYLRLPWRYLEPAEGQFNWPIIDSVINRWVAWGHTISFRITCKEIDLVYATPEWVRKAGAKGKFITHPELDVKAWAPDYGDPVFLNKLENFHKAFAARYDAQPWIEYIDIGSAGDWGEGHTAYSGWDDIPVAAVKKHIDIYKKYYTRSLLLISDDFIGQRDTDDGADYEIYQYCLQMGLGFRDDSGNVQWYRKLGFGPSCIRTPELYSRVYKTLPVTLESDHYHDAKRYGMWGQGEGFEKAIRETHASFIAFHYYPNEWLQENKEYAGRMTNLCGYWYFPKFALMPDTFRMGANRNYLRITWENHGVAPAYHRYKLFMKLVNKQDGTSHVQELAGSDNRSWMPGEIVAEQYRVAPHPLASGQYDLLINMHYEGAFHKRDIELALKKERELQPGWYKLGEVTVQR